MTTKEVYFCPVCGDILDPVGVLLACPSCDSQYTVDEIKVWYNDLEEEEDVPWV